MTKAEKARLIEVANKILSAELESLPDGGFWRNEKGLKISMEDLEFIKPFILNSSRVVVYTIGAVRIENKSFRLNTATFTRGDDAYIIIHGDEMEFKYAFKEMVESALLFRTAFKHYREGME